MIGLLQRVKKAQIDVKNNTIAQINQGLLLFIAIQATDGEEQLHKMTHKIINYRVFADANDKMNLSVADINGDILLVPQFTLAADTNKGLRPSFSSSANPDFAEQQFLQLTHLVKEAFPCTQSGQFGADMLVSLINDGPVTFSFFIK